MLSTSDARNTPVTWCKKPGANPRAFLRGYCLFQSNLGFPGKSVSSRFDFLCVIYGKEQAAECQVKFIILLLKKTPPKSTREQRSEPLHKLKFLRLSNKTVSHRTRYSFAFWEPRHFLVICKRKKESNPT